VTWSLLRCIGEAPCCLDFLVYFLSFFSERETFLLDGLNARVVDVLGPLPVLGDVCPRDVDVEFAEASDSEVVRRVEAHLSSEAKGGWVGGWVDVSVDLSVGVGVFVGVGEMSVWV
jgi:hypothetical protein